MRICLLVFGFLFIADDDVLLVAGYKVKAIVSKVQNDFLWLKLILLLLKCIYR